jgi:site-specific recombinase XerD
VRPGGVPPWGPNRLRHSAATEIRAGFSLDHAKSVMGHSKVETTTVYAEADLAKAVEVMDRIG